MKLSLLIIIVLFLWVPATAQIEVASSDEIAIYEAILQHTILPESMRLLPGSKPEIPTDVILIDRTIPTCSNVRHYPMGCISERIIQGFTSNSDNPNLSSYNPHLPVINEKNLIELLFERNAKSCSLPEIGIDGAIVTSQDRLEETVQEYSGSTKGYAGVTRPAYSNDGHALVYAVYVRGSLSGGGWIFYLQRDADGWQVVLARQLWIS